MRSIGGIPGGEKDVSIDTVRLQEQILGETLALSSLLLNRPLALKREVRNKMPPSLLLYMEVFTEDIEGFWKAVHLVDFFIYEYERGLVAINKDISAIDSLSAPFVVSWPEPFIEKIDFVLRKAMDESRATGKRRMALSKSIDALIGLMRAYSTGIPNAIFSYVGAVGKWVGKGHLSFVGAYRDALEILIDEVENRSLLEVLSMLDFQKARDGIFQANTKALATAQISSDSHRVHFGNKAIAIKRLKDKRISVFGMNRESVLRSLDELYDPSKRKKAGGESPAEKITKQGYYLPNACFLHPWGVFGSVLHSPNGADEPGKKTAETSDKVAIANLLIGEQLTVIKEASFVDSEYMLSEYGDERVSTITEMIAEQMDTFAKECIKDLPSPKELVEKSIWTLTEKAQTEYAIAVVKEIFFRRKRLASNTHSVFYDKIRAKIASQKASAVLKEMIDRVEKARELRQSRGKSVVGPFEIKENV